MSKTLYTNGTQHTPFPRGPLPVGCKDVCTEGEDAVLFRMFFPVLGKKVPYEEQDPASWTDWYLGQPYSTGFAKFIITTQSYSMWILRALSPFLFLYGDWLTKSLKVPTAWLGGEQPDEDNAARETPAGAKMPVLVASHGMAAHRSVFSCLASDLASHGFLVLVLEHRDGSSCASFHVGPASSRSWMIYSGYERESQLDRRVEEVFGAVAAVRRLNDGTLINELEPDHKLSAFKGALDVNNMALLGHSYGGTTTLRVLADPRNCFKVGVTLDPWMFPVRADPEALGRAVAIPVLSVSSEDFNQGANLKALRRLRDAHKTEESMFYTMKGTTHHHGNDAPWLAGRLGWWITSGNYTHPPEIINELQNNLILTFLDKYLDIEDRRLLASVIPVYEQFIQENKGILLED
ncbi:platelet-activating factor acetylhydrolase-like isoform X2 [Penaeus monodon]|uniref:platelet-activating factor acetylhydrolase-like isoform X2 n=1 Tax=Penaeus monodon TaxID=6687 RepID=UPI0018A7A95D|nr:platelet-activating factor acetylhydrolase-like isoform X2 [Penaeus monodon]